jgi:hypothetical protein
LLIGCEKSASDDGVQSIGDSGVPGTATLDSDAAPRDPTGAAATLDAQVTSPALDARSPQSSSDASVGDSSATPQGSTRDGAVATTNVPEAGSDASLSGGGSNVVPDAAVDPPKHPTWGNQACNKESPKPGCSDEAVALCICRGPEANGGNEFCCTEKWDYLCADGVEAAPECKFTTTKCCEAHPTDGCEEPTIEQCVCDEVKRQKQEEMSAGRDPAQVHDCCTEGWSDFCAILAEAVCGAACVAPAQP